jgi:hypothetical protein
MKPTPTRTLTFRTSTGYTLYRVDGAWVDNLDPDLVDMTFDTTWRSIPAEAALRPSDHNGEPLDGHFVTTEEN